ncbi:hypothetical protein [Metapseudomonas otitidis]|uniref:hypothetical protein n=1 Tax=Metapseudomonas otitidis TaxID=319939 RepID=UPI0013F6721E|nr:hypothetical protein [Pseudomonas otitidis]
MTRTAHVDLSAWGEVPPQWIALLAREVERSTRSRVAERVGISRTAVTLALQNRYPSPSTARIERRVLEALGRIECVALGEVIDSTQCQSYRERPAPTHNPPAMQHWRACQHCPHNPNCTEKSHGRH